MASNDRVAEFFASAGNVRMVVPPANVKPVDYAKRFVVMQSNDRVAQFFSAAGKLRVVAPDGKPGRENHTLRFAESIGAISIAPKAKEAPPQAVAFDKLPPQVAVERYPELKDAYQLLAQAKQVAARMPNEENRKRFVAAARDRISSELHAGNAISISPKVRSHDR